MPAYDNVVIEPQFVLTSEAAIEAVVFIVTNNKGYINVICCLVSKGPFIYYVSIGLGGWVQKISIFAYVQYINNAYIVGGWVRKSPKTCLRNI